MSRPPYLEVCEACGDNVASNAWRCPHCGAAGPQHKSTDKAAVTVSLWVLGGFVGVLLLSLFGLLSSIG